MNIETLIPDLLNRQETLILQGVVRSYSDYEEEARIRAEAFSADGIFIKPSETAMAYGNYTRQQVLEEWKKRPERWVHLYGGWNNGMTLEINFCAALPGDVPFAERKVKHWKEGLATPQRPRIWYNYPAGWQDMLKQKGIQKSPEELEEMAIGDLLLKVGGAPTRWDLMVTFPDGRGEYLAPPTTSVPFPGCEYGNGFVVVYLEPEFPEGKIRQAICNNTGSRGPDSIALTVLLVFLKHGEERATQIYIEDAMFRAEQIEKKGGKPPYTLADVERYAKAFVGTLDSVAVDMVRALSRYEKRDIRGFQYAVNIFIDKLLGAAMYKFPRSKPYCWVKTSKGWEVSV